MNNRVAFILLALIGFPFTVFGQSEITGAVYSDDQPLNDVQVSIRNEPNRTTITDRQGYFSFSNLSSKSYTLVFNRPGFLELIQEVDLTNQPTQLKIRMKLDPMLFEEVAVVGSKMGLTKRTPYNVSRLDAKDISMKSQPSGVMGLIQQEPGVNAAQMGHGIVKPFIRGLGFSRVVTIYQGSKIENHQWGADHGLGVNDLGIGSVDIIKGPASILYGSGALGGVLIMNDDEGYNSTHQLTGNIGTSFNTVSNGYRTYGSLGKKFKNNAFFNVEGAYENHADYTDGSDRIIGNSRFNSSSFRAHIGVNNVKFKNKLSYAFNEQYLGIIDDNEMSDELSLATFRNDRNMQLPFQRVTDHLISYRQEYLWKEKWKTELDASFHFNQREEIEDEYNEVDLGLNQQHIFYSIRVSEIQNKNYKQKLGVQGSLVRMSNAQDAKEVLFPNAQYVENGLYYLGTFTKNRHTIQGGVRGDFRLLLADANQENVVQQGYVLPGNPVDRTLGLNFFGVTGSFGYSYEVSDQHLLKINASTGFRSPDLAEILSNGPHPGTNRFELGNVGFGNEQSFQADASWTHTTKNFSWSASVFGNYINNYIFFTDSGDTTENGLNVWEFQQTIGFLYGAEFELKCKPLKDQDLNAVLFGNVIRGKDLNAQGNLTFIPADRVGVKLSHQFLKRKNMHVFLRNQFVFRQDRPGIGELNTNAYNLVDLGLSYQKKWGNHEMNIGVTVFNLLNRVYVDHISILRAFEVSAPGRNIMLNVNWRF